MGPRRSLLDWLLDMGLRKALSLVWAIFLTLWLIAMGILIAYIHYRERL